MKLSLDPKKYGKALKAFKVGGKPEPMRDWLVLLLLSALFLVASIAWNAWFFLDAVSDKEPAAAVEGGEEVDTSAIERAKDAFRLRAEAGTALEGRAFIDPSRE